jgi:hypothetical protein
MSYNDRPSRLQAWAHRKGIARRLNSSYAAGRWMSCYVETALPWAWLARRANRWTTPRLASKERVGRWRWRWMFVADGLRHTIEAGR